MTATVTINKNTRKVRNYNHNGVNSRLKIYLMPLVLTCLLVGYSKHAVTKLASAHRSTHVASLKLCGEAVRWSPGNQRLLVLASNEIQHKKYAIIFQHRRSGFAEIHRVEVPFTTRSARWIGKSDRILLEVFQKTKGRLIHRLLILDKTSLRLTPIGNGVFQALNPDGTQLIMADRYGNLNLLCIATGKRRSILNTGNNGGQYLEVPGAWSSDGDWYAFMRSSFSTGRPHAYKVVAICLQSSKLKPNILASTNTFLPSEALYDIGWDGRHILFGLYVYGEHRGQRSFCIYSVDEGCGSVRIEVPPGCAPLPYGRMMWLAHDRVAFPVEGDGSHYVILDVSTRRIRRLNLKDGSDIDTFSFSHDAKWLAVGSRDKHRILILNCKTGRYNKWHL